MLPKYFFQKNKMTIPRTIGPRKAAKAVKKPVRYAPTTGKTPNEPAAAVTIRKRRPKFINSDESK